MPKVPRDIDQQQAIRALVRTGGVYQPRQGKGSHQAVTMPSGQIVVIPYGTIRVGTLTGIIKEAGLTVQQFIDSL